MIANAAARSRPSWTSVGVKTSTGYRVLKIDATLAAFGEPIVGLGETGFERVGRPVGELDAQI